MARKTDIRFRRSATQGAIPTTSQLNLGELALNTYDGKLYMKKSVGGTESVVEVGAGSSLASTFTAYEYTATSNQTTFSGSDNNSNTLAYNTGSPPQVQVFMNGILLDEGSSQDYTATNGTSVVLTTGASAGDLIQIHAYKSSISTGSNVNWPDNKKATFGDSDDLQIYHDGSNSYIDEAGTGSFNIRTDGLGISFVHTGGSVNMAQMTQFGVTLNYNGSTKLTTTSAGVTVAGDITSASDLSTNVTGEYTVDASGDIILDADGGDLILKDGGTEYGRLRQVLGGLTLTSGASSANAIIFDGSGNQIVAGNISLADSKEINFGTDDDLKIYHNGSHSNIQDSGTGNLRIAGSIVEIAKNDFTETMAKFTQDGASELYHNGSKKFETTSSGTQIQGSVAATTAGYFPIVYGGSASLQLKSNTGAMFAQFTNAGAAELYHNNAKKLNTKADGVLVTGELEASSLDINGASVLTTNNVSEVLTLVRDNATTNQLGISFSDGTNTRFFGKGTDNELYLASSANISGGSKIVTAGNFTGILNSTYYQANDDISVGTIASGNITTTGYLRGPSTFTIDPASYGDNTGTVIIAGNLQVDGSTTTINSTTLTVDDLNITLASGAANSAAADGAGLTVDCGSDTDTTFTYNGSSGQWETNTELVIKPRHTSGTPPTLTLGDLNNQYQSGIASSGHLTMRASGSGNLYWQNDNTYLMMLTDGGDLSIGNGTTAPTNHRIHIKTAVDNSFAQGLVIERSANTDRGYINYSGGGFQFRSTDGDPIVFGELSYEHMRINPTTGNVGINVGSPTTGKLVVQADANQAALRLDGSTTSGQSFGARIRAGTSSNDYGLLVEDTSAVGALIVRGNGNVGIGTTTPGQKLDVIGSARIAGSNGTGTSDYTLLVENTDTNAQAIIKFKPNSGRNIGPFIKSTQRGNAAADGDIQIGDENGTIATFNVGRVGIGTVSPNAQLEILSDGSLAQGAEIRLQHANNNSTDVVSTINFANNAGSVAMIQGGTTGANNTGYISFFTDNAGTSSEKMRILANGNVGIGTASPGRQLDVSSGGSDVPQIRASYNSTNYLDLKHNLINAVSSGGNDALQLQTAGTTGLTIDVNQNVGIGTTSPTQDLHVVGNGYFSGGLTIGDSSADTFVTTGITHLATLGNNVGIGTTNPQHKLHVNGGALFNTNTGSDPVYITRSGATDQALKIYTDDANVIFESIQDESLDNYGGYVFAMDSGTTEPFFDIRKGTSSGGTKFRVDGSGDIGIGTTTLNSYSNQRVVTINGTTHSRIDFETGGTLRGSVYGDSGSLNLDAGGNFVRFFAGNAEKMRIAASGNVGIGTTSPDTKLDITTTGVEGLIMNQDTGASSVSSRLFFKDATRTNLIMNVNGRLEFRTDATIGSTSGAYRMGVTPTLVDLDVPIQIKTAHIDTYAVNTTSTSAAQVDTFSASSFRSARFTVQITNTTDSTYQVTEILLIHDGTTPSITEYGTIFTGSAREASFDADIVSGNVRLLATPASGDSMQFKVTRHSITV